VHCKPIMNGSQRVGGRREPRCPSGGGWRTSQFEILARWRILGRIPNVKT